MLLAAGQDQKGLPRWCGYGGYGDFVPSSAGLPHYAAPHAFASSGDHSAAISDDVIYVCGQNVRGQLGLGDTQDRVEWTASHLPDGAWPADIACGLAHTVAACKSGGLYVCGSARGLESWTRASGVPCIEQVASGRSHAAALAKDGTLYMWGCNENGQLGLGDTADRFGAWTRAPLPDGVKVGLVACGDDFTAALGEDGSLYVTGRNDYGQLGLGDTLFRWKWTLTPLSKVTQVACGGLHMVAVADFCGFEALMGTGCNRAGQLGLDRALAPAHAVLHPPVHAPGDLLYDAYFCDWRRVPTSGVQITQLACGVGHTVIRCNYGTYACGTLLAILAGTGTCRLGDSLFRELKLPWLPEKASAHLRVACGPWQTIVLWEPQDRRGDSRPRPRSGKEVVMAAVRCSGAVLAYTSKALRADREVVLAAVETDGEELRLASDELRADKEVVLAAVKSSGRALAFASEALRADKEVILEAVLRDNDALEHARGTFKQSELLQFAGTESVETAASLLRKLVQRAKEAEHAPNQVDAAAESEELVGVMARKVTQMPLLASLIEESVENLCRPSGSLGKRDRCAYEREF